MSSPNQLEIFTENEYLLMKTYAAAQGVVKSTTPPKARLQLVQAILGADGMAGADGTVVVEDRQKHAEDMSNEMAVKISGKDSVRKFKEFIEFCKRVTDNDTEVVKLIEKRYNKTNSTYLNSVDFQALLLNTTEKILTDLDNKFVCIKEFVTELKAYGQSSAKRKRHDDEEEVERHRHKVAKTSSSKEESDPGEGHSGHTEKHDSDEKHGSREDDVGTPPPKHQPTKVLLVPLETIAISSPTSQDEDVVEISPDDSANKQTDSVQDVETNANPDRSDAESSQKSFALMLGLSPVSSITTSPPKKRRLSLKHLKPVIDTGEKVTYSPFDEPKPDPKPRKKKNTSDEDSDYKPEFEPEASHSSKPARKRRSSHKEEEEDEGRGDSRHKSGGQASDRQIRKLEMLLGEIDKEIKKLEEEELALDDLEAENTNYILLDRYKKKFVKVWNKLCEVKGRDTSTGRQVESKFQFEGTRYQEVNKKISKFINRHKVFPDFHDIKSIITMCNRKYHLRLGKKTIESLARDAFTEVGNKLQERRMKDFTDDFGTHLTDKFKKYDDPALYDRDLRRKLEENRKISKTKIDEVINKYAYKQTREGETSEDEEEEGEEAGEEDIPKTKTPPPPDVVSLASSDSHDDNEADEEEDTDGRSPSKSPASASAGKTPPRPPPEPVIADPALRKKTNKSLMRSIFTAAGDEVKIDLDSQASDSSDIGVKPLCSDRPDLGADVDTQSDVINLESSEDEVQPPPEPEREKNAGDKSRSISPPPPPTSTPTNKSTDVLHQEPASSTEPTKPTASSTASSTEPTKPRASSTEPTKPTANSTASSAESTKPKANSGKNKSHDNIDLVNDMAEKFMKLLEENRRKANTKQTEDSHDEAIVCEDLESNANSKPVSTDKSADVQETMVRSESCVILDNDDEDDDEDCDDGGDGDDDDDSDNADSPLAHEDTFVDINDVVVTSKSPIIEIISSDELRNSAKQSKSVLGTSSRTKNHLGSSDSCVILDLDSDDVPYTSTPTSGVGIESVTVPNKDSSNAVDTPCDEGEPEPLARSESCVILDDDDEAEAVHSGNDNNATIRDDSRKNELSPPIAGDKQKDMESPNQVASDLDKESPSSDSSKEPFSQDFLQNDSCPWAIQISEIRSLSKEPTPDNQEQIPGDLGHVEGHKTDDPDVEISSQTECGSEFSTNTSNPENKGNEQSDGEPQPFCVISDVDTDAPSPNVEGNELFQSGTQAFCIVSDSDIPSPEDSHTICGDDALLPEKSGQQSAGHASTCPPEKDSTKQNDADLASDSRSIQALGSYSKSLPSNSQESQQSGVSGEFLSSHECSHAGTESETGNEPGSTANDTGNEIWSLDTHDQQQGQMSPSKTAVNEVNKSLPTGDQKDQSPEEVMDIDPQESGTKPEEPKVQPVENPAPDIIKLSDSESDSGQIGQLLPVDSGNNTALMQPPITKSAINGSRSAGESDSDLTNPNYTAQQTESANSSQELVVVSEISNREKTVPETSLVTPENAGSSSNSSASITALPLGIRDFRNVVVSPSKLKLSVDMVKRTSAALQDSLSKLGLVGQSHSPSNDQTPVLVLSQTDDSLISSSQGSTDNFPVVEEKIDNASINENTSMCECGSDNSQSELKLGETSSVSEHAVVVESEAGCSDSQEDDKSDKITAPMETQSPVKSNRSLGHGIIRDCKVVLIDCSPKKVPSDTNICKTYPLRAAPRLGRTSSPAKLYLGDKPASPLKKLSSENPGSPIKKFCGDKPASPLRKLSNENPDSPIKRQSPVPFVCLKRLSLSAKRSSFDISAASFNKPGDQPGIDVSTCKISPAIEITSKAAVIETEASKKGVVSGQANISVEAKTFEKSVISSQSNIVVETEKPSENDVGHVGQLNTSMDITEQPAVIVIDGQDSANKVVEKPQAAVTKVSNPEPIPERTTASAKLTESDPILLAADAALTSSNTISVPRKDLSSQSAAVTEKSPKVGSAAITNICSTSVPMEAAKTGKSLPVVSTGLLNQSSSVKPSAVQSAVVPTSPTKGIIHPGVPPSPAKSIDSDVIVIDSQDPVTPVKKTQTTDSSQSSGFGTQDSMPLLEVNPNSSQIIEITPRSESQGRSQPNPIVTSSILPTTTAFSLGNIDLQQISSNIIQKVIKPNGASVSNRTSNAANHMGVKYRPTSTRPVMSVPNRTSSMPSRSLGTRPVMSAPNRTSSMPSRSLGTTSHVSSGLLKQIAYDTTTNLQNQQKHGTANRPTFGTPNRTNFTQNQARMSSVNRQGVGVVNRPSMSGQNTRVVNVSNRNSVPVRTTQGEGNIRRGPYNTVRNIVPAARTRIVANRSAMNVTNSVSNRTSISSDDVVVVGTSSTAPKKVARTMVSPINSHRNQQQQAVRHSGPHRNPQGQQFRYSPLKSGTNRPNPQNPGAYSNIQPIRPRTNQNSPLPTPGFSTQGGTVYRQKDRPGVASAMSTVVRQNNGRPMYKIRVPHSDHNTSSMGAPLHTSTPAKASFNVGRSPSRTSMGNMPMRSQNFTNKTPPGQNSQARRMVSTNIQPRSSLVDQSNSRTSYPPHQNNATSQKVDMTKQRRRQKRKAMSSEVIVLSDSE